MMFAGVSWGAWDNIWWFVVYGMSILVLIYMFYANAKRISQLAVSSRQHVLLSRSSACIRITKLFLYALGLLFVYVALLAPQWDEKEELVEQEGRDVLIALDVSRSMLAEDVKPNRLALSKAKIKKLVARLHSERVGLILFAGDAFVHCPLTHDMHAFAQFLDQVDAHTISSGTTALDKALSKAIQVYESMPKRAHSLVVAFTDGEDFSTNLSLIKSRASKLGMHLFTVGVGTSEGAPVPIIDAQGKKNGYEKEANGQVVISRLNEGILENLAHDVGGVYVHTVADSDADIEQIVSNVEQFEKEAFDHTRVSSLEDKYYYFVGVSFICLLLEWVL